MRYHDYHINEYTVSDRGETITFNLVYGYPGSETDRSTIQFNGVCLYSFIHTNNAIVTDIYELSLSDLEEDIGPSILEWDRMYSVRDCEGDLKSYLEHLHSSGYSAWRIESAIGFYGFVVAKSVGNA